MLFSFIAQFISKTEHNTQDRLHFKLSRVSLSIEQICLGGSGALSTLFLAFAQVWEEVRFFMSASFQPCNAPLTLHCNSSKCTKHRNI